jgi:hypothetical protein
MKFDKLHEAQAYLTSQGFKPGGNKAMGWMTTHGQHAFIDNPGIPSQGVRVRFYVSAEHHSFRVAELHEVINREVDRRRQAEAAHRAVQAAVQRLVEAA